MSSALRRVFREPSWAVLPLTFGLPALAIFLGYQVLARVLRGVPGPFNTLAAIVVAVLAIGG